MKRIITMATPNIKPYCSELIENQKRYANTRGYEHIVYENLHPDFKEYHPVYSRLGYLLDSFRDGAEKVVWADIDVAFIDHSWDIGQLLEIGGITVARWGQNSPELYKADGCWLAGYDQQNWPGAYLCFGLLAFRNNWLSISFIQEIVRSMKENPDQSAREQFYAQVALIKINFAGVRLCSAEEIGCFSSQIWHDGVVWKEGMPTVHLAGPSEWSDRQKVFIKHYQKLVK